MAWILPSRNAAGKGSRSFPEPYLWERSGSHAGIIGRIVPALPIGCSILIYLTANTHFQALLSRLVTREVDIAKECISFYPE